MQSTWKGFLDGVMGRADAKKEGSGSGVLTAKSRVKLGDLSVSPMGRLVVEVRVAEVANLTVSSLSFREGHDETCVRGGTLV